MGWELSSYFSMFLILFPGSVVRSGLHSSLFFTVSGMWFLLVWPAFMAILTGLWHRLSNSLPWVCLILFPLRGVARSGHRLGSISWCRRDLCQGLVIHLWLRGLTWRPGMRLIKVARSLLLAVSPPVLPIVGGKGLMGVSTPDVLQSSASSSSSSAVFKVGMLFTFLINGEALHLTGLCFIWFGVTIFSLGPILPCSITSGSSMSRQLWLIIPLFRRRWMSCLPRQQLNYLVVLVSILAYLWFLSIQVVSGTYLTWSVLIVTGGSCLSRTAVKLDSHLAQIFVAKFLRIIKLIIIIG